VSLLPDQSRSRLFDGCIVLFQDTHQVGIDLHNDSAETGLTAQHAIRRPGFNEQMATLSFLQDAGATLRCVGSAAGLVAAADAALQADSNAVIYVVIPANSAVPVEGDSRRQYVHERAVRRMNLVRNALNFPQCPSPRDIHSLFNTDMDVTRKTFQGRRDELQRWALAAAPGAVKAEAAEMETDDTTVVPVPQVPRPSSLGRRQRDAAIEPMPLGRHKLPKLQAGQVSFTLYSNAAVQIVPATAPPAPPAAPTPVMPVSEQSATSASLVTSSSTSGAALPATSFMYGRQPGICGWVKDANVRRALRRCCPRCPG